VVRCLKVIDHHEQAVDEALAREIVGCGDLGPSDKGAFDQVEVIPADHDENRDARCRCLSLQPPADLKSIVACSVNAHDNRRHIWPWQYGVAERPRDFVDAEPPPPKGRLECLQIHRPPLHQHEGCCDPRAIATGG
jgi:hypothetical protein